MFHLLMNRTSSSSEYSSVTVSESELITSIIELQPAKICSLIVVTPKGILTDVSVKGKVDFPQIGLEKVTTERGIPKVSKFSTNHLLNAMRSRSRIGLGVSRDNHIHKALRSLATAEGEQVGT